MMKKIVLLLLSFNNLLAVGWWQEFWTNHLFEKGLYQEAGTVNEQLLTEQFNDLNYLVNMGKILYQQGQYLPAATYFNKVLSQFEQTLTSAQKVEILAHLGHSAAQQEDWQTALRYYEDLLKIDTNHLQAQKNLEIIKKLLAQQEQQSKQDQSNQEQSQQDQPKQDESGQPDDENKTQDQSKQDQNSQATSESTQPDGANHKTAASQNQPSQAQSQASSLNQQEKEYLAAIDKNDQQANAYMLQKQLNGLKGAKSNDQTSNW